MSSTTPQPELSLTHADIAQLFDPYAQPHAPGTPEAPYTPDVSNLPPELLPAAIECLGLHGYIITPLYAAPAQSLLAHEALVHFGTVRSLKFQEQTAFGDWLVIVGSDDIHHNLAFAFAQAEMDALLARDGVPLFGRPTREEYDAYHAATASGKPDATT